MKDFTRVVLYTSPDGSAKFREERLDLPEGGPDAMLSRLQPSSGYQIRFSPVGFRSQFHCTTTPQYVFILSGEMEIGLHDGTSRVFCPGQHFYSADTLPAGEVFDSSIHGHWSRQTGPDSLVTLFLRSDEPLSWVWCSDVTWLRTYIRFDITLLNSNTWLQNELIPI